MKTNNMTYQQAANIAIVQFETLTGEGFHFLPAGVAIASGDLVIKELDHSGDVNHLLLVNKTGNHYLLTDMDLLKGAKQNRVVNISVLVMPHEQKKINVSCVERSRWQYDSPQFKPGDRSMDADSRLKKLESLKRDLQENTNRTQYDVWETISMKMESNSIHSPTEDYNKILEEAEKIRNKHLRFNKSDTANAIAVFDGEKLVGFDLFGNRLCYAHYFDLLEKDALDRARDEDRKIVIGQPEAFYRLGEFLDQFEQSLEEDEAPGTPEERKLKWSGNDSTPGFSLEYNDQPVHMAGFLK